MTEQTSPVTVEVTYSRQEGLPTIHETEVWRGSEVGMFVRVLTWHLGGSKVHALGWNYHSLERSDIYRGRTSIDLEFNDLPEALQEDLLTALREATTNPEEG